MTVADTNGDNQLSSAEFGALLGKLLGKVSTAASSTPATTAAPAATTPKVYEGMGGFNYDKLNDLNHKTPKYVMARTIQDLGLKGTTSRGNLQPLVDSLKNNGFPNAVTSGDDSIDFGDGFGPIDVITVAGNWWWGA